MRWIEATIDRSERISARRDDVWQAIDGLDNLRWLMRGVESIRENGENLVWILKEQGAGGISVRPQATTRLRSEPPERLRIERVESPDDNSRIEGAIELLPENDLTVVRARLELAIALPIPFFVASIAQSIVQRRVDRMADHLLERISERF